MSQTVKARLPTMSKTRFEPWVGRSLEKEIANQPVLLPQNPTMSQAINYGVTIPDTLIFPLHFLLTFTYIYDTPRRIHN